jgi:ribonuclease HII
MEEEYRRVCKELKNYSDINEAISYLSNYKDCNNPYIKNLVLKFNKKKKVIMLEEKRFLKMKEIEIEMQKKGFEKVAGIYSIGKEALAGPVVATSVILPQDFELPNVCFNKKLSYSNLKKLSEYIKAKALSFGISEIDFDVIEKLNVSKSNNLAMRISVYKLDIKPDAILSYTTKFTGMNAKQFIVQKEKTSSISLFAASILARYERNKIMKKMDEIYPEYGFSKHKGYKTEDHIDILKKKGLSPIHRKSFIKKVIREVGYDKNEIYKEY